MLHTTISTKTSTLTVAFHVDPLSQLPPQLTASNGSKDLLGISIAGQVIFLPPNEQHQSTEGEKQLRIEPIFSCQNH